GTCPRLVGAGAARPQSEAGESPRIVRLPLFTRPAGAEREAQSGAAQAEPRPLRPLTPQEAEAARSSPMVTPTPLRSRLDRAPGGSATAPATVISRLSPAVDPEPAPDVEAPVAR